MTDLQVPVTGFDDTGLPAWQEIDRVLREGGLHSVDQGTRDELAGMLIWARYARSKYEKEENFKHSDKCGCGYCT